MDNYNNFPGAENNQAPQYPEQPQYDPYAQPQQQYDQYGQPVYDTYAQPQQAYAQQPYFNPAPVAQLDTNRSFLKIFLLSLITFGIYPIIAYSKVSTDINIIASRYDGKKTAHYCLMMFVLTPITCGIYGIVWFHQISDRIGNELKRRGIDYSFGASTFWLWCFLGSFILVGPIVYTVKMLKAMNLLSENYNMYG